MKGPTANIQKGGALLGDARRVVELWDLEAGADVNLARIRQGNLLGKTSRARSDDVLLRVISPRLIEPGQHVIAALKELLTDPRAFAAACYYEATRDDALLAAFAEGPLFAWYTSGRIAVDVLMTIAWLNDLTSTGIIPPWSETIQTKVARGLLAALRDFGILRGTAKKEIERPHLSLPGFAYIGYRLYEEGASSRGLVDSRVWRRWLLDKRAVHDLFSAAARRGLLTFASAGSSVRIDWLVRSLPEAARAAA